MKWELRVGLLRALKHYEDDFDFSKEFEGVCFIVVAWRCWYSGVGHTGASGAFTLTNCNHYFGTTKIWSLKQHSTVKFPFSSQETFWKIHTP
jgi:hypothetical protein